jgi:RND family efflux transporter MFP subunit
MLSGSMARASAAGLLFGLALCGCGKTAQSAPAPSALKVKVRKVEAQPVGDSTEYIASLKSRNASILQPEVEGQVTRIFVKSGDHVQAGQPLLEIDPRRQEATVHSQDATRRSRMAALEWARTDLARKKQLAAAGVVSRQDLDQAQAAYDAAKADVDSLAASVRQQEVQLRYYTVKALAAGTIGDIPVRVGDRVVNATVLTTLDKGDELEAYISVPSEKAGVVHLRTPVEILDDHGQASSRVSVTFVSPRVDSQNQLLLIKAMVPNSSRQFRNEQVVHVRVIWKEESRPLIPVTAVSRMAGQTFAFVAESQANGSVARQRTVRLGDIVGGSYVVLDGIRPGEQVITTGVQMLADGMAVTPET